MVDDTFRIPVADQSAGGIKVASNQIFLPSPDDPGTAQQQQVVVAGYSDESVQSLLLELIKEIQHLRLAILSALH